MRAGNNQDTGGLKDTAKQQIGLTQSTKIKPIPIRSNPRQETNANQFTQTFHRNNVDACSSTIFDTFHHDCLKLPGSDNFIMSSAKSIFEKSIANNAKTAEKTTKLNVKKLGKIVIPFRKRRNVDRAQDPHYDANTNTTKPRTDIICINFKRQLGRHPTGSIYTPSPTANLSPPIAITPHTRGHTHTTSAGIGLSMPRERDGSSRLPAWLQIGNGARLVVDDMNEKALMANCYMRRLTDGVDAVPLFDTSVDVVRRLRLMCDGED